MRNSRADFETETLGIAHGGAGSVFRRELIDRMFNQPRVDMSTFYTPIKTIFMAIDPCTGTHRATASDTSDFAIVSMIIDPIAGVWVICGLDAFPAHDNRDWVPRLEGHVKLLRQRKELENALLVAIPENNLGLEAGWIRDTIFKADGGRNHICMVENEWRAGLQTTHSSKRSMMILTRERLEQNFLQLEKNIVTTGDPDEVLAETKTQLHGYTEVRKPGKEPHDPVRISYTGKVGGKKDDIASSLQFCLFGANIFLTSPQYAQYH